LRFRSVTPQLSANDDFIVVESIDYRKSKKILPRVGTAFLLAHFPFVTAETPLPSKRQ
jgi:hypothetical protein